MNKNFKTIKELMKYLFVLGVFAFALQSFAEWKVPATSPSGGNTNPPFNQGVAPQQKTGALIVEGGLRSMGPVIFDTTLQIPISGYGANKVLTSDAQGNATWQTPGGGGGGDTWTRDIANTTTKLTNINDKVGIGVALPNNKLQVAGLINFNDTLSSTALGKDALLVNTGAGNTAFGYNALKANSTGISNTAIGKDALKANTTGRYNTAIGAQALEVGINTESNTAIGYQALQNNIDNSNVAVGYQAAKNSTGGSNLSIGSQSLFLNNSAPFNGNSNVAVGYNALSSQTVAYENVAIGSGALSRVTTGRNNTGIGAGADVSIGSGPITNATAIGYNANVTASNTMVFGNADVVGWGFDTNPTLGVDAIKVSSNAGNGASLTVAGAWMSPSDRTKKHDIENISVGLKEILSLRPVDFKWNGSNKEDLGFIAQEVKPILPKLVSGEEGDMAISYSQMTAVLTRAIQEQQDEIKVYREQLNALKERLKVLESIE